MDFMGAFTRFSPGGGMAAVATDLHFLLSGDSWAMRRAGMQIDENKAIGLPVRNHGKCIYAGCRKHCVSRGKMLSKSKFNLWALLPPPRGDPPRGATLKSEMHLPLNSTP